MLFPRTILLLRGRNQGRSVGHERIIQSQVALPSSEPHPDPIWKRNISPTWAKVTRGSLLLEIRAMVPPASAQPQKNSPSLILARNNLESKPVLSSLSTLGPSMAQGLGVVNSWVKSLLPLRLQGPFLTCTELSQISLAAGTEGITQVIYQMKGTESLVIQKGCANLGDMSSPLRYC